MEKSIETTKTPEEILERKRVTLKPQAIAMGQLSLSDDFRFRMEDDESTISDYEGFYRQYREDKEDVSKTARCPLDALAVFREEDDRYIVVAGRLRFLAAQRAGLETLQCVVITDRDEAIRFGLESNRHGLPLTRMDRVNCIRIAIMRFPGLSNRKIATMIGIPPSTVNEIVLKYKLLDEKRQVQGLDGKMYFTQRKSRKAVKAETATAEGSDPSVVDNGIGADTSRTAAEVTSTGRPFHKVLAVLGESLSDDQQRIQTYLDIVKAMVAEGFSDEKSQQEFLRSLESELFSGNAD